MNIESFWENRKEVTELGINSGALPNIRSSFTHRVLDKIEREKQRGNLPSGKEIKECEEIKECSESSLESAEDEFFFIDEIDTVNVEFYDDFDSPL